MDYLSESTRLLYSQLLSQCLHAAVPDGRGISFVKKTIKESTHWYLQLTVGSSKKQHYLGPDSSELRATLEKEKELWDNARPDRLEREKLVAMLAAGGAHSVSASEGRVIELMERAGVFIVGGVLVGSHAFATYSNMLGVRWPGDSIRTHDVDIAGDDHIRIGLSNKPANLKKALMDTDMGFIEVPALDRKSPSTRFRIQGKQLSVDVLTPMTGKPISKPVFINSLNTYAEPVRYLDYLLDDSQPAVIVSRAGILVNVPSPARYALHKLVISAQRSAAMQTKSIKDINQADHLLSVLLNDRPGDIQLAFEAAKKMPTKFSQQLATGIEKLPEDLSNELANKYL